MADKKNRGKKWLLLAISLLLLVGLIVSNILFWLQANSASDKYNKLRHEVDEQNKRPLYAWVRPFNDGIEIVNRGNSPFDGCVIAPKSFDLGAYIEITIDTIIYPGVENEYILPYSKVRMPGIKNPGKNDIKYLELTCKTEGAERTSKYDFTKGEQP